MPHQASTVPLLVEGFGFYLSTNDIFLLVYNKENII